MKHKLLFLIVILLTVSLAACEKEDSNSMGDDFVIKATLSFPRSDIATVRAVLSFRYPYTGPTYELASAKYENGSFEMRLPATVLDKYLDVSGTALRTGEVALRAYNDAGEPVGELELRESDPHSPIPLRYTVKYVYANESHVVDKSSLGTVHYCSYEKGWNVVYTRPGSDAYDYKYTEVTEKPEGVEDFEWVFFRFSNPYGPPFYPPY